MKLILNLGDVESGATVRKATGEQPLIVRDQIKIYGEQPQTIQAGAGTRFLVSDTGGINAMPANTQVSIWGNEHELLAVLERLADRAASK